ncbi:MAG: ribose-phosphate pyrophosphokinase [Candidatus Levybacteria bacterium]|nr:ribose-phosphate pyrophosphokinase [Candidatus Levybacteria bacterium]
MPNTQRTLSKPAVPEFILLTGRSNPRLAKKIAKLLGHDIFDPVSIFSDGEIRVRVPENMRRRHVFIIQPTSTPVNESIMEIMFMIDASRRSSAREITLIIPYFGYSRQDRKEMPRVPISSSVVANMFTNAGASRIVTVDIHSDQQQGFIQIPWDNLYASYSLVPALKKKRFKNLVVASPDKGGMTRATGYAKRLGASDIALVYKERDINVNNKSEALGMIGNVKGRDVLLVDDMLDTGGTIAHAASYIKQQGAKSVRVAVTHGLFSGKALEHIKTSPIEEVIVTDTILQRDEVVKNPKITVISVAPLLVEAIKRIESGDSISRDLFL